MSKILYIDYCNECPFGAFSPVTQESDDIRVQVTCKHEDVKNLMWITKFQPVEPPPACPLRDSDDYDDVPDFDY